MILNQVTMMPKNSEKKPRVLAADVRRKQRTIKDLQEQADTLRGYLQELEGLISAMKERGYKSMEIDGVKKPDAAFENLRGWLANVDTALNRKRLGL